MRDTILSGQYTPSRPSQKQGKEQGRAQEAANRRRRTGRGNTASQARNVVAIFSWSLGLTKRNEEAEKICWFS